MNNFMGENVTAYMRYMFFTCVMLTVGCASSHFGLAEESGDSETVASTEASVLDTGAALDTGADVDAISSDSELDTVDTLAVDSGSAVDTLPVDNGPPDTSSFTSTPGFVSCSSASDACEKSKGERCCIEDTGVLMCRTSTMPACSYTKTYACDESADCDGSKCCLLPAGGSQCGCLDGAIQLCMTNAECGSGVCEPYSKWSGHGRCRTV